jgi:hypothetical protein
MEISITLMSNSSSYIYKAKSSKVVDDIENEKVNFNVAKYTKVSNIEF